MTMTTRFALLGVLALAGTTGACNDFLTGGELSTDPNRPTSGTPQARFEATQPAIWAVLTSDPARITSVWTQQFEGAGIQYGPINSYVNNETTTNGFNDAIYQSGGLVDIRAVESDSRASGDSLLLGAAQVEEALLVGTAADLFGDVIYSQALTTPPTPNPQLDPQLQVYATVQALLDTAIIDLGATGPTNFGPGDADLVYGGNAQRWIALAHTLKARFYLHTAEVDASAYQNAYDEAKLGITDPAGDYVSVWSGAANEQNFWYQFDVVQRQGYISPNAFLVNLLQSSSDPRLGEYFNTNHTDLSDTRVDPTFSQPIVTAQEDLLIWAEAAQHLALDPEALQKLNDERALAASRCSDETGGSCTIPALSGLTGNSLLQAILTEKYVAEFQNIEAWNDYKRTCFPNFTPTVAGQVIPARFFYDTSERQTDTNIPDPAAQPSRNANDPANATDPFGNTCKGQLGSGG